MFTQNFASTVKDGHQCRSTMKTHEVHNSMGGALSRASPIPHDASIPPRTPPKPFDATLIILFRQYHRLQIEITEKDRHFQFFMKQYDAYTWTHTSEQYRNAIRKELGKCALEGTTAKYNAREVAGEIIQ